MTGTGRYSRFVRAMRVALPVAALALLALLLTWPRLHGPDSDVITPAAESVDLERDGRVRLDRPRYVGEASGSRGFSVEAAAARVDPTSPRRIELERMRAELPADDARDIAVEAGRAVFDRDSGILDLEGGIDVVTDDGYRLHTEAAKVAVDAGLLRTLAPVAGSGPKGELVADRLVVSERGEVLRFSGNVRARLPVAEEAEPSATGKGS